MRFAIAVIVLAACGGSPKPASAPAAAAPVAATPTAAAEAPPPSPPPPPPPPTDSKHDQVAMGDPCEGGEATGPVDLVGAGGGAAGPASSAAGGGAPAVGHGGMGSRRPGSTQPTVKLGAPTVNGDLDKAIIRRYLKRNIQKFQYCYEKELLAKPGIAGNVVAKWTINDKGLTEGAGIAKAFDRTVGECVVHVLETIEYPKPKSGMVQVSYPITFAQTQ